MVLNKSEAWDTIGRLSTPLTRKLAEKSKHMSDDAYGYYLDMITLTGNAWKHLDDDINKTFGQTFNDILSFNLRYYPIAVVCRALDDSQFSIDLGEKYDNILEMGIRGESGHYEYSMSCYSYRNNSINNWEMSFHNTLGPRTDFYNERLRVLNNLLSELSKRTNVSASIKKDLAWTIKDIEEATIRLKDKMEHEAAGQELIGGLLLKAYGYELPKVEIPREYQQDFSIMKTLDLKKLAIDNFALQALYEEEKDIEKNSHGRVYTYNYFEEK